MDKKGAIGLSVNFLVVVIISIVILAAGIIFLYQLLGGAAETKALLDAQTQSQLERLLIDEGKKVAMPKHSANVYPGDFQTFGVGVLNIAEEDDFSLSVSLSAAVDADEKEIVGSGADAWLLYDSESFTLGENEHKSIAVGVDVPKAAQKGTYIFDVKVTCTATTGCDPYDTVKKFSVVVK